MTRCNARCKQILCGAAVAAGTALSGLALTGVAPSGIAVAEPLSDANALLVEAVQFSEQARTAPPEEAIHLYVRAIARLDAIVTDFPESDIAVALVTHQPIGSFQPWTVRQAYAALQAAMEPPASDEPVEVAANPCGAHCAWEVNFGTGTSLMRPGEDADAATVRHVFPHPDHSFTVVGQAWDNDGNHIFIAELSPDGTVQSTSELPGLLCSAAERESGLIVGTADDGEQMVLTNADGQVVATAALGDVPWDEAVMPDGMVVVVGSDPLVSAFGPDGAALWRWDGTDAFSSRNATATAVTLPPTGGVRVLVQRTEQADDGQALARRLMVDLYPDGALKSVLDAGALPKLRSEICDFALRIEQIAVMADGGWAIRHMSQGIGGAITTVLARFGPDGALAWQRLAPEVLMPGDPIEEFEPPEEYVAEEINAMGAASDGGLWIAGLIARPGGNSSVYAAHLLADGTETWRHEWQVFDLEWERDRSDIRPASIAETPDGDVVIAYTAGLIRMEPIGWVKRIDVPAGATAQ